MSTPQSESRLVPVLPTPGQVAIRHELTVAEVVAQVQKIQQVMDAVMKPDIHYGIIPGTSRKGPDGKEEAKPTLLKAGAEKLCLVFRLDPEYEIVAKEESREVITFLVRCVLFHIPTGERIASGIGSCSSREEKYAYRKAARLCPECGKPAIIKGRAEYGGGWVCFKKRDGCGAKFADGDEAIEAQEAGKVPTENVWDQHNTILKMAEKRALVAAVLNGTAASDFFTQDAYDEFVDREESAPKSAKPPVNQPERPSADGKEPEQSANGRASAAQIKAIHAIARRTNEDGHVFAARILGRAVEHLSTLTTAEASKVIEAGQPRGQQEMIPAQRGRP